MDEKKKDKKRRAAILMKQLLEPIYSKLEIIDVNLKNDGIKIARHCRNEDLKNFLDFPAIPLSSTGKTARYHSQG